MYNQSALKKIIDKALVNLAYNAEAEKLMEPVRYVLSMGGKRIRPVLALMTCNLFSDKIDDAVIPVTGLEIFHNFTLVHDDIMDQALMRRNMQTVHSKWNVNQAILSGDVMPFISYECLLQTPSQILSPVLKTFTRAAMDVCIGQQMDMDFEKSAVVTQDEYLRMIELKTAALIAASAKIGAIFGGAEEREIEILYEFGRNLGLAFQIQDDLLDVYGDVKTFGKISGGDIVADKKTFLFIKAMEIANTEQRKILKEQYTQQTQNAEDKIRIVTDIYNQLNIKSLTENIADDYINASLKFLEKVSVSQERKEELIQMTTSLAGRNH
ncbi:MAG: polyprenyl synthetase family protein [Bacteroidales bacterium]|nr:polyprenyl synthetase family protein [Bacteroidales bacterium]